MKNKYNPHLVLGARVVFGKNGSNLGADFEKKVPHLLELIAELKVTTVRVPLNWACNQPGPNKISWEPTADKIISLLHQKNIEIVGNLSSVPRWASELEKKDCDLFRKKGVANLMNVVQPKKTALPEYSHYLTQALDHYGKYIKYYEFWNEPDGMGWPIIKRNEQGTPIDIIYGGNPELYTAYLKATYEVIKNKNPDFQLAGGSLESHTSFLEDMYKFNGAAYFDALSIHPYGNGSALNYKWIDEIRNTMVQHGDEHKPLWLTEYGWNIDQLTEKQHGEFVQECLTYLQKTPFITIAHIHTLNDWRIEETNPDSVAKMGLVDYSLKKRPAFFTFQQCVKEIKDKND